MTNIDTQGVRLFTTEHHRIPENTIELAQNT
jgi:hypothetical protein